MWLVGQILLMYLNCLPNIYIYIYIERERERQREREREREMVVLCRRVRIIKISEAFSCEKSKEGG